MPDDVIRVGASFDVSPITANIALAADAVETGTARMNTVLVASGLPGKKPHTKWRLVRARRARPFAGLAKKSASRCRASFPRSSLNSVALDRH